MPVAILDIAICKARKGRDSRRPKVWRWETVREFPDGQVEQVAYGNYRRRVHLLRCVECETGKPAQEFSYLSEDGSGFKNGLCLDCWLGAKRRNWATARAALRELKNKLYSKVLQNSAEFSSAERRAAVFKFASPSWRDKSAIAEIYEKAKRLAAETGKPHDVDHYYPLLSPLCCGLHVPENLRVMMASENRAKGNSFPMENSPAWDGSEPYEIIIFIQAMAEG